MHTKPYYYAGGEQVSLDPDPDYLAVDLGRVDRGTLEGLTGTVVGDIALFPTANTSERLVDSLRNAGALLPVYKAAGAHIAVLPEVRVELSGKKQQSAFRSAIRECGIAATIEATDGNSFVLRPQSGKGTDALSLANYVHEHVRPPMAQARFLRIVPRPRTSPR